MRCIEAFGKGSEFAQVQGVLKESRRQTKTAGPTSSYFACMLSFSPQILPRSPDYAEKNSCLDDDLIIHTEILGQIVKNLGHYPVVAHNAHGVNVCKNKKESFDAILLDLWLSDSCEGL